MTAKKPLLLVAAALIAYGAFHVTQRKAPSTEVANALLYPDLLDRLNDTRQIAISTGDDAFTLARAGEQWTMVERGGFPVKSAAAREALVQLSALKIREAKTSKPENYATLGVADELASGTDARRIIVSAADADVLVDLLVGKARTAKGVESPGHYVRRLGEPTAYLVEGDLGFAAKRNDWMDTQVLDLPVDRVRKVTITHVGNPPVVVSKENPQAQLFTLHDAPEGYESRSSAVVSSIGGLLLDVRFEDVAAKSAIEGLTPRAIVEVQTFDGLVATLEQYDVKEKVFVSFDFTFNEELVLASDAAPVAAADTPPASPAGTAEAPVDAQDALAKVQAEVTRLKDQTAPWVYELAEYKTRIIDKKMADLIKVKSAPLPTPEPIENMRDDPDLN